MRNLKPEDSAEPDQTFKKEKENNQTHQSPLVTTTRKMPLACTNCKYQDHMPNNFFLQ